MVTHLKMSRKYPQTHSHSIAAAGQGGRLRRAPRHQELRGTLKSLFSPTFIERVPECKQAIPRSAGGPTLLWLLLVISYRAVLEVPPTVAYQLGSTGENWPRQGLVMEVKPLDTGNKL